MATNNSSPVLPSPKISPYAEAEEVNPGPVSIKTSAVDIKPVLIQPETIPSPPASFQPTIVPKPIPSPSPIVIPPPSPTPITIKPQPISNQSAPVLPVQTSSPAQSTITNTIQAPVYQAPVYSAPSYAAPFVNYQMPQQTAEEQETNSSQPTITSTPENITKKAAFGLDNFQIASVVIGGLGLIYLIFFQNKNAKKQKGH